MIFCEIFSKYFVKCFGTIFVIFFQFLYIYKNYAKMVGLLGKMSVYKHCTKLVFFTGKIFHYKQCARMRISEEKSFGVQKECQTPFLPHKKCPMLAPLQDPPHWPPRPKCANSMPNS